MAKAMGRLETSSPAVQVRALARLGQLSAFWDELNEPMRRLFNAQIEKNGAESGNRYGTMGTEWVKIMSLITRPDRRAGLPALETAFSLLNPGERAEIISRDVAPCFAPHLGPLMGSVRSFDEGEFCAEAVLLPCAGYLSPENLAEMCHQWAGNPQCWGRRMPEFAGDLYDAVSHLRTERRRIGETFIRAIPHPDHQARTAVFTGYQNILS